jgi:hypothetical protein
VSLGFTDELAAAYREPLLSMALFFAGIMLLDPPTSPGRVRGQYLFGFVVAVVGVVLLGLAHESAFLPVGLLAGNAWLAVDRMRARMRGTTIRASAESA